ncbi:MAG: efflux RND transporter permease subunit, partial [Phycisphaerales bacterium]|nr:efflux RND transporter permease subunit [Phycisphaerales bacterium]
VDGVADLHVEQQTLVPQINVRLKPDAATLFGLTAGHVRRSATTLLQGRKVGEIFERQMVFDVAVRGDESLRRDPYRLNDLLIDLPAGGQARLGDIADVTIVPAPNEIKREAASRRIDIICNARGRDLGSVARDVRAKVEGLTFERGYHPEFLGEFEARQASQRRLLIFGLAAVAMIVLLLYVEFESIRLTLLILLTLAFSLVGGVAAAFATGGVLSLGSLVGFVTVLGIAGRNGIMMVSHYEHLLREEGETMGLDLLIRGAQERLAPILMTALSTGLGLIPLVIAGNKPGHEIEYPLAVVIVGGLVTSTIMNLLFLPALYRIARARN